MKAEIWKDIPGYEGVYQASNFGRIKSLDRVTSDDKAIKGRIRKLGNSHGYKSCMLSKSGINKTIGVHIIIAMTFIGERKPGYEVHHINENKSDNRLENLQYIHATNHRKKHASQNLIIGEKNPMSKITRKEVIEIRQLAKSGKSHMEISKVYNLSRRHVTQIIGRVRWGWLQ